MDHIGIDLGRESQVCVRSSDGAAMVPSSRRRAVRPGRWARGWRRVSRHGDRGDLHRGVSVGRPCSTAGHEARVVAATLVCSWGVGQRGLKNDVRDARTLG